MATVATDFKTKPYRHQEECLIKYGSREYFALLAEQGTGKTWVIINNVAQLWQQGKCDAMLVMAPNGVHENWTRIELLKHMPDWVQYQAVAWSASLNKREASMLGTLMKDSSECLRIFTMNWEALQSKRGLDVAMQFVKTCRKLMIVADESDMIKNPSAIRSKNFSKLKQHSKYRRIMTGTPSANGSPFDLWNQFMFLDEGILGTTSYYAFKAEYAEMLPPNNPLVQAIRRNSGMYRTPQIVARGVSGRPKYRNLDKLSRLIEPHSFRVLKKDCLDLPEKIYKTVIFELTPKQREIYRKAKNECRLAFENEDTPFNKLAILQKLAQITSGYYLHPASPDDPVRIDGDNPKLDRLMERIQYLVETGEQLIVWARYRIEIADIVARLKALSIGCVQYHGGVTKEDRKAAIDDFESGRAPVFVGNQQAGGTGITLIAASTVLYFSNDFSLRNRLQSEDRAHRIGQTKVVTYWSFAAKGTVDEITLRALTNKKDVADCITDFSKNLSGPEEF